MNAVRVKEEAYSALAGRFGNVFEWRSKRPAEFLPTGVAEIDSQLPGFPRGAITEIHGDASSGRTSLLLATLAVTTKQDETCALVDCSETFDVASASKSGVDLNRLLWVRCADKLEAAFKAVDLLLHGGGFGLVVLNLSDVPSKAVRRIIASWWFRFRRAIEDTPTALVVMTSVACVRSCAAVVLELENEATMWPGTLSLISEKSDLTGPTPKLSLVTAQRPSDPASQTHSFFLQGMSVRVNQLRPSEWPDSAVRFSLQRLRLL